MYLHNISNATIINFICNGSANGGNLYIDSGCSNLTITQNTFENDSYSGSGWPFAPGIVIMSGLNSSTISFNTFNNLPNGGILAYAVTGVNVTDNTFTNVWNDDMHALFDGCVGASLSFLRNTCSTERIGL
jgi:hypothetical protein